MSKTPATEVAEPNVPEYDGVETWEEVLNLGSPSVTKTAKINMSTSEVKKFLGDNDPNLYFRNGKIPTWYATFGRLVDPEDDESLMFRKTCQDMPELLLFKHKTQPLYNILVPKPLSEYELGPDGEQVKEFETADMRAIAFGGSNAPRSFERVFFNNRLDVIHKNLLQQLDRIKEWRAHRDSLLDNK